MKQNRYHCTQKKNPPAARRAQAPSLELQTHEQVLAWDRPEGPSMAAAPSTNCDSSSKVQQRPVQWRRFEADRCLRSISHPNNEIAVVGEGAGKRSCTSLRAVRQQPPPLLKPSAFCCDHRIHHGNIIHPALHKRHDT